jgi:hypothetical protein
VNEAFMHHVSTQPITQIGEQLHHSGER